MPQPRSPGARKSTAANKAKKAPRAATAKTQGSSVKKRPASSKAPATGSTQRKSAGSTSSPAQASGEEPFGAALATVRERLGRGLIFTGERLQETIDDTARRGRMTHKDAEELAQRLISAGRRQTEELLCELEQIVERGGDEFVRASRHLRDKLR
jgi:hypothetical protein